MTDTLGSVARAVDGPAPDPGARLLHRLIEAQCARTPYGWAAIHGPQHLTYAELDARADQLAARLRALRVGRDRPVVVCLPNGFALLVAILATWKAGGCYVPVDPAGPSDRTATLLARVRPTVCLTTKGVALRQHALREHPLLLTDSIAAPRRDARRAVPAAAEHAEQLAYVIHTSGSTGEPKGVMVPHRAIANTFAWRQEAVPYGPGDRALVTFSYVFDASLFELVQPLLAGAAVVFPEDDLEGDPVRIVRAIRDHDVTVLGVVPSWLSSLTATPGFEECRSLRLVFCGGEPLTPALVTAFARVSDARLFNMYGPTETAMEATWKPCVAGQPVTIGAPIGQVATYLLDEDLHPVAPGHVGELFIGGAGVARGYLGRPGLTGAAFLPDPFHPAPGSRMYRTGDLCRRSPQGELVYVGRGDRQVKVNGHRVELDEVEAALRQDDHVHEAAVVIDPGRPEVALVAYVVPAAGARLRTPELRRRLATRLPRAMLPTSWVSLSALPRTASGKLDRRQLPDPPSPRAGHGRGPTDPLEQRLLGMWRAALSLEEVDRTADFFDHGGNSIQAAILAHRLSEALGAVVYSVAVYDAPSVAAMAGYLRENYEPEVLRLVGGRRRKTRATVLDERHVRRLRTLVAPQDPAPATSGPPNRSAVFVLSPPRSGSTLLRVMLGSHPRLFSPPELQLLNYRTLRDRHAALADPRDDFWLQGTVRALMELDGCDAAAAGRTMQELEGRDLSVREFYGHLQERLGDRTLVDKTPNYSLDVSILQRAEDYFDRPRYLHLVRDPGAVVASFVDARLQVFYPPFLAGAHGHPPAAFAELLWNLCHENILGFLGGIPGGRRHTVYYEKLVTEPERTMRGVCDFLGIAYDPAMADPYAGDQRRLMTDATHPLGRMLGDVKFHGHGRIRPEGARPRGLAEGLAELSPMTRRAARRLGYTAPDPERPRSRRATASPVLTRPAPAPAATGAGAFYCVLPPLGEPAAFRGLAGTVERSRPFWVFRGAAGPGRRSLPGTVEEVAAEYVDALTARHPGPYLLGGWSTGGVVAFEMARQLVDRGEEVAGLALLSGYLVDPSAKEHGPVPDFLGQFLRWHGLDPTPAGASPSARTDTAYRWALEHRLLPADTTPIEFARHVEDQQGYFQRQVSMARSYRATGRLPRAHLIEPVDRSHDGAGPFLRWESVVERVVRHRVPGDHYSMLRDPHVRAVATALERSFGRRGRAATDGVTVAFRRSPRRAEPA
jgi:amino acid adenylation domain-containing protein